MPTETRSAGRRRYHGSRVNEDIIGECYIYLISRFASDAGKKAGEFYTPRCEELIRLILSGDDDKVLTRYHLEAQKQE